MQALPSFDVYIPSSFREALSFLSENREDTKVIAGGTDVVPSLKQQLFEPEKLLDIKPLRELHGIHEQPDGGIRIGALTTITELVESQVLQEEFPVLQKAAATVAGPNLRNVGTIGGNICLDTRCYWYNQSFFWRQSCSFCLKKDGTMCHVAPGSKRCWAVYSGDTAAALLTLDARIRLSSASGDRMLPLSEFFVNDGSVKNKLERDEILSEVLIPGESRGLHGDYQKFRIRGSVDYPLAGVAVALRKLNGTVEDLRIGLTAVNPLPVLLRNPQTDPTIGAEGIENIRKLVMRTAKPLKTSASTMEYRRHMVGVLVKRALEALCLR